MIVMYCDRCGKKVPPDVKGGGRIRVGDQEKAFHICPEDAELLLEKLDEFCEANLPRNAKTSLSEKQL